MASLKYWDGTKWTILPMGGVASAPPGVSMSGSNLAVAGAGAWTNVSTPSQVNRQSPAGSLSGSVWTVPEAGLYRVWTWVQSVAAAAATYTDAGLLRNGAGFADMTRVGAVQYPSASGHIDVYCSAGDTLQMRVRHGDSVARDLIWRFAVDLLPVGRGPAGSLQSATADVNFGGYRATLLADPTSAQDAATKAYVDVRAQQEGVSDFSVTVGTYTIPNASWGSPGWYAPIVVGPSQTWECMGTAAVQNVTAAHQIRASMLALNSSGGALGAGYGWARGPSYAFVGPLSPSLYTSLIQGRFITDSSVPPNTTVRLTQQFYGDGANGRLIRDGTYYQTWGWRRI